MWMYVGGGVVLTLVALFLLAEAYDRFRRWRSPYDIVPYADNLPFGEVPWNIGHGSWHGDDPIVWYRVKKEDWRAAQEEVPRYYKRLKEWNDAGWNSDRGNCPIGPQLPRDAVYMWHHMHGRAEHAGPMPSRY